ncbi:hypothetical protein QTP70_034432 [Hemibagrus guttatus]|uniref:Reverse transcriptase n=1 Tax=Hemibagrus guttatus TaxID=175788 RepID=A0AAE0QFS9_9TELE|nr:hypothetical protein QTP70_034432 [Hemibagrus guttatus]
MVMADPNATVCERLTRRHGVRVVCAASVEDCCLAVGNVVGHENIVSASRMNSAIVVFLNDVEKVRKLTQNGIVINNEMILVSPLSSPAKKVMLSNVPPFISDEAIGKELSRSRANAELLFLNSPLKASTTTSLSLLIQTLSVLDVAGTGHLARACPERQSDPGVSERPGQARGRTGPGDVPPAATVRPAAEGPGAAAAPDLTESEPQAQPAAQTPTGATSAPREKPRTGPKPGAGGPSHARLDQTGKKPWSTGEKLSGSWSSAGAACTDRGSVWRPPEIEGILKPSKVKKTKMNDLLDITAQGALVRSRFKSAAEMDAPSKFFFSLEQKNGQKRFIHAVRTESGDLLSESTEIRKQTVSFYSKLYSSEWSGAQVVEDSFLVGLPKLSERAARELDRELSLEELHEALQRMENGRASGIDGLPAEFYKAFWAVIGQDVLDVLRDSILRGELPLSCRRAVLTLLPKKGDLGTPEELAPRLTTVH